MRPFLSKKGDVMRVIIAGSRTIRQYAKVCEAVQLSGFAISRVVSGLAEGVDMLAVRYALEQGLPCDPFPPQWKKWGRSAGYRRNEQMAQHADALIAIWDGRSPGTRHMIAVAKTRGLPVYVVS
jgi:YspA, cpYpsA-related SLOG family